MEQNKEKVSYKPRSIRMHEETWKQLKKRKGDKSWNLFINSLLNEHERK